MEASETQKRAIRLAKILIKELGEQSEGDTLSRWMAHYIAEQITLAKRENGAAKAQTEQHVFAAIIKLWQHRSFLPRGARPFADFDSIFKTLEQLDPETSSPFYFADFEPEERNSKNSPQIEDWLKRIRDIDMGARISLEYALHQAALYAADEKTQEWLENALGPFDRGDIPIIIKVVYEKSAEDPSELEVKVRREKLEGRIKQLDQALAIGNVIRDALVAELQALADLPHSAIGDESDPD